MMQVYIDKVRMPVFEKGCALTIGNFDGVHRGHKKILSTLRQRGRELGLPTMAILFEPQPQEYFSSLKGMEKPYRLSPLRDKLTLLENTGDLDNVWAIKFNREFASIDADDFVRRILIGRLNVRHLLIGDDFKFGKNRGGDFNLLSSYKEFSTERTPSYMVEDMRASSTLIRKALSHGDIDEANSLLGHDYVLSGRVMHGKKLGRTMDSPTANIYLPPYHYALSGVFITECQIEGEDFRRPSVSSFGFNPTVDALTKQKLEAHIFDFHEEIYGKRVHVYFKKKLRDELKFDSIEVLKAKILEDMELARKHFGI